jgi:hypothetical protein
VIGRRGETSELGNRGVVESRALARQVALEHTAKRYSIPAAFRGPHWDRLRRAAERSTRIDLLAARPARQRGERQADGGQTMVHHQRRFSEAGASAAGAPGRGTDAFAAGWVGEESGFAPSPPALVPGQEPRTSEEKGATTKISESLVHAGVPPGQKGMGRAREKGSPTRRRSGVGPRPSLLRHIREILTVLRSREAGIDYRSIPG